MLQESERPGPHLCDASSKRYPPAEAYQTACTCTKNCRSTACVPFAMQVSHSHTCRHTGPLVPPALAPCTAPSTPCPHAPVWVRIRGTRQSRQHPLLAAPFGRADALQVAAMRLGRPGPSPLTLSPLAAHCKALGAMLHLLSAASRRRDPQGPTTDYPPLEVAD